MCFYYLFFFFFSPKSPRSLYSHLSSIISTNNRKTHASSFRPFFPHKKEKPRIKPNTFTLLFFRLKESHYFVHHCSQITMAFTEFRPLEEKSLIEYIKTVPALHSKLGKNLDDIKVKEVGDGNLNFVYIIVGPDGSFVIKQVFFFACVHFVFHAVCVYRFSGHFAFYWLG